MTFFGIFGNLPTMCDNFGHIWDLFVPYISVGIWRFTKGEKREQSAQNKKQPTVQNTNGCFCPKDNQKILINKCESFRFLICLKVIVTHNNYGIILIK